jgi:hypothetical protein
MSSTAFEIASTIQSGSIKRHPSPHHDINPSTAASKKFPVEAESRDSSSSSLPSSPSRIPRRRRPRKAQLPPLPDLRFEQSYLASIPQGSSYGRIGWITLRDQVMMPLIQGTMWTLAVTWWRHWNKGASLVGQGTGTRLRRWWWKVNDWKLPEEGSRRGGKGVDMMKL